MQSAQGTAPDYSEHAIGAGTDDEAPAYVQISIDGKRVSASLTAVIVALNREMGRAAAY